MLAYVHVNEPDVTGRITVSAYVVVVVVALLRKWFGWGRSWRVFSSPGTLSASVARAYAHDGQPLQIGGCPERIPVKALDPKLDRADGPPNRGPSQLPQTPPLTGTLPAAELADDPNTDDTEAAFRPAVAAVATGYAADVTSSTARARADDSMNVGSQRRIAVTSSVKARN